MKYPKLRWPLNIEFQEFDGKKIILLTCPIGVSQQPLALIAEISPILHCFQGTLSYEEILTKFEEQGLLPKTLDELIELLDSNLMLANSNFFAAQTEFLERFQSATVREPALAGLSYNKDGLSLGMEIDSYLNSNKPEKVTDETRLIGLVAPHIDYRRGKKVYGTTYNHLTSTDYDLYILLGTSHQYSKNIFHLTKKDFNTPLGALSCDRDFVDKLATRYDYKKSFADEILHKKEHSLELQTPFLKRLKNSGRIVPILVGGFHHMLEDSKYPEDFAEYDDFASSLSECLREAVQNGQSYCIISGVDMAHMGSYFGKSERLSKEMQQQIEQRDMDYIYYISTGDKKALFRHIAEDQDARSVCGYPSVYLMMDVLKRLGVRYEAKLYSYEQAADYNSDCLVSFCGMGLYST